MIEYLPVVLTGIGIIVAIVYYTLTLRNANKTQQMQLETRQAAILSDLFQTFRSIEFRRIFHSVMIFDWKNYDDWTERFNEKTNFDAITTFSSVIMFFNGIGVLVRRNLIDISLVYDLMGGSVKLFWERYETVVQGDRDFWNTPLLWGDFEYLYRKVLEIDDDPDNVKRMAEYFQRLADE